MVECSGAMLSESHNESIKKCRRRFRSLGGHRLTISFRLAPLNASPDLEPLWRGFPHPVNPAMIPLASSSITIWFARKKEGGFLPPPAVFDKGSST